jgi:RimJ/RimL family protein N-acetyltransferase
MKLRDIKTDDYKKLSLLTKNEDIMRFIGNGKPWSDTKIMRFIQYNVLERDISINKRTNFYYMVEVENKTIGVIGFHLEKERYVLTVYFFKTQQGKGYFSKALKLLLNRMRKLKPKEQYLLAQVHLKNTKMLDIMAKKYFCSGESKINNVKVKDYLIPVKNYTFLIASQFGKKDEKIKALKKRGIWKEASPREKIDFLYLDGKFLFSTKFFNIPIHLKNIILDTKTKIEKDVLYRLLQSKEKEYLLENYDWKEENFKHIDGEKIWILKPVEGYQGKGQIITKNLNEMKSNINKYKNFNNWIFQKYIEEPMLYDHKKFHIRCHLIAWEKRLFYFPIMPVYTAKENYTLIDFNNKNIHDSHYWEEQELLFFPNIVGDDKDEIIKQMEELFKDIKEILNYNCYEESTYCYEILAVDIMLTEDKKIKLLEINNRLGWKESSKSNYNNLLFENHLSLVVDHYFPTKNSSKTLFKEV